MSGLASCGETRTRSSCAETWRRSSSSARVSFSNWASCSFTEAKMLAVDSTSESSMKVRGRAAAGQGKKGRWITGGGGRREKAPLTSHYREKVRERRERKGHRSEKTDELLIPEPKMPSRGFTAAQKESHHQAWTHHQCLFKQDPLAITLFNTPQEIPIERKSATRPKGECA